MSSTLHQNWEQLTLGDLGRVVTGRTPPSSKPELFGDQYPFITPTDMAFSDRSIRPERGISDTGAESLSRIKLPAKTPCFVCIGATIGKLCLTSEESFTNQQINSIVVNKDRHNPDFVYYLLRHVSGQVKSLAGGAATPIINKSAFSEVPVLVPSLEVQESIASILSAYDDLIENNTRRIEILEEMARRLYEEWFVHFRFPGHEEVSFKESELGEIPEGWCVKTVAETFQIMGGGTPSKKVPEYWDGGDINWFSPTDLTKSSSAFMEESSSKITELGLKKSSAKLFPEKSVMMTSRATIGVVAINTQPATTNQGFITCLPNDEFPLNLMYHWLKDNVETFISLGTGATFKEISKGTFKEIQLAVPPHDVSRAYEEAVNPMMQQVLLLQRKNANLRAQRDLLLPKLVSGEIDVSDIPMPDDKEVEAA